jgi:hypothetical protein
MSLCPFRLSLCPPGLSLCPPGLSLCPFGLSLSKPRAALRQAECERPYPEGRSA